MSPTRTALILTVVVLYPLVLTANDDFRGIPKDQGLNRHPSPVMGLDDLWFIDFSDNFTGYTGLLVGSDAVSRNDGSPLIDTYVDDLRIGFVPPFADVPVGPLVGDAAQKAGQWMGAADYVLSPDYGGSVRRANTQGTASVYLPWRVTPGLGDFYLIELAAIVAEGESTRLAYFGDVTTHPPTGGLMETGLGQLVLEVTRGVGDFSDQLNWTVGWWEVEGGDPTTVSGIISDDQEAQLALQLGWNENTDTFDAWIDDRQLISGKMGRSADVHGIGFELIGLESRVTGILAAVPEPNTITMAAVALVLLLLRRRKTY